MIGAGIWRAPRFRTADRLGSYIAGVNIGRWYWTRESGFQVMRFSAGPFAARPSSGTRGGPDRSKPVSKFQTHRRPKSFPIPPGI